MRLNGTPELPAAVDRDASPVVIEHVPTHEVELIDPDGNTWSLGGVYLGSRFTVFGSMLRH